MTRGVGGRRAQSNVIGVALLLGLAVVSLGVLTASIGAIVQDNAASADARRVATDLDAALAPVAATGPRTGRVSFAEGSLYPVDRDLRVLDASGTVRRIEVGGLVFESGSRRVVYLAGAVARGPPGNAVLDRPPPITATLGDGGVLVVGAPRLNTTGAVGGTDVRATLRTDVTHTRTTLGNGTYRVAIETVTPGPFERYFADRGATVRRADLDGDGLQSVVASYHGERRAYLVIHDLQLEVAHG